MPSPAPLVSTPYGRSRDRRRGPLKSLLVLGGAAAIVVSSQAAQPDPSIERLLARNLGFLAGDLERLAGDAAVIRSLNTPVREELAHVGVVYLDARPEAFVDRFRDIEEFERGPGVLQVGRFGSPPHIEDLASLTLSPEDFAELPACRPGDCELKLSADAIEHFRSEVDWSSPQARREVNAVARRMLLDLVAAYQRDGNAALGAYFDRGRPLPVADQLRGLLASREALPAQAPELFAYLDRYPRGRPEGTEEFFYWAMVDFGLKPTIRVNHVVIHPVAARAATGVAYVIAIKQLYASHYFHSTLELRFLLDRAEPAGSGAVLVSIARSRSDGMTGVRGRLLRPIAERRSREALRGYLEHVRRQLSGGASGTP